MEEQFFIMKPKEIVTRPFKLYPTTDQAAKYVCAAILKDSEFNEADRAECQFTTTATVLDNGSQITPFQPPKNGINGFFESIESIWNKLWDGLADFITGKTCRRKCSGFFDFSCHIQYICMSWIVMFGLLLAIFPTVLVLIWLLHQKGLFDPLYDWWEDHFLADNQRVRDTRKIDVDRVHIHLNKHHKQEARHHKRDAQKKRRSIHNEHRHNHSDRDTDYYYHLHHVHKDKRKHGRRKNSIIMLEDDVGHHRRRKERETIKALYRTTRHSEGTQDEFNRHKHGLLNDTHFDLHPKRRQ